MLGATAGRTEISVKWKEGLQPPQGRRLVLSSVMSSLSFSAAHQASCASQFPSKGYVMKSATVSVAVLATNRLKKKPNPVV